jgi:hypothetical protein
MVEKERLDKYRARRYPSHSTRRVTAETARLGGTAVITRLLTFIVLAKRVNHLEAGHFFNHRARPNLVRYRC